MLAFVKRRDMIAKAELIESVAIYPAMMGDTDLWSVCVTYSDPDEGLARGEMVEAYLSTAKGDQRYFRNIDSAFKEVRLFYGGTIELD